VIFLQEVSFSLRAVPAGISGRNYLNSLLRVILKRKGRPIPLQYKAALVDPYFSGFIESAQAILLQ
jgi:hypothetical protein